MPDPNAYDTEAEWMKVCVPTRVDEGDEQDQAVAVCLSMWRERNKSIATIKAIDDTTLTIGGYGVIWGGRDLVGEYFTKDTDFWFDKITHAPMTLYEHGQDKNVKRSVIGRIASKAADDIGLWIEAQIDRANEYAGAIERLTEKGVLGWSSGAVGHLVDRDKDGKIVSWPIVEFSLTPTPAEPRTLGVQALRALAEAEPAVKALLPQEDVVTPSAGAAAGEAEAPNIKHTEVHMDEVKEATPQAPPVDVDAIATAAATKAVEAWLKAQPKATPLIMGVEDSADRALKGNPFKSLGEMAQLAVTAARSPHQVDERLLALKDADGFAIPGALLRKTDQAMKVATGLGEVLGAAGGFLVGTDTGGALPERTWGVGSILSRITMGTISANSNAMTYYGTNETSRVTGSRHGGVQCYWVSEGTPKTPSTPSFRQIELKLRKCVALVYVTDELLADASALTGYLGSVYNDELAFMVEHAIVSGNGAGQPLGILNSPCLVTQAIEVGQLNTTFVAENAIRMWSRRYTGVNDYVWLINQDVTPQLYMMELPAGGGGQLVFMPPGGLSGSMYGTLLGRPIIEVEYASTLGTLGDVILASLSQYQGIQKGGVESASSIHFVFDHDETVFRFVYRFDGQPTWNSAVTPHSGSANTVSPFVTLAGRP